MNRPIQILLLLWGAWTISLSAQSADFQDWELIAKQASAENKAVLLIFSGSDWCKNCMRLEKEVWQSPQFKTWAADKVLVYKADFPRSKKNRPNPEQEKQNEHLVQAYNPEGKFPQIVVIYPELDSLGRIEYHRESPDDFLQKLQKSIP